MSKEYTDTIIGKDEGEISDWTIKKKSLYDIIFQVKEIITQQ